MSPGTTNHSSDASSHSEAGHSKATDIDAGHPQQDAPTNAAVCEAAPARPKARPKRPRPCFEDGALTRVFKFPSKTFPRSTYYVTGDEIIIRIRKARKKWKLVVPKKRIVSYRTNRWFAKPRWVELELTFTQASRFGLVEPRPRAQDGAASAASTVDPATTVAPEPVEPVIAAVAPEVDQENGEDYFEDSTEDSGEETVLELACEPEEDAPIETGEDVPLDQDGSGDGEWLGETDDPRVLDEAPSETEAAVPRDVHLVGDEQPLPVAPNSGPELPDVPVSAPLPVLLPVYQPEAGFARASTPRAAQQAQPVRPRRWANAYRLAAASVLLVAMAAGGWLTIGSSTLPQVAEIDACASDGSAAECAGTSSIVTGSVDTSSSAPSSAAPSAGGTPEIQQPSTEVVSETVEVPVPSEPAAGEAESRTSGAREPTLRVVEDDPRPAPSNALEVSAQDTRNDAPIAAEPATVEAPALEAQPLPVTLAADAVAPSAPAACHELPDIARANTIRFAFASASLDQPAVAWLEALAARLRACPGAVVTVEGHTDSDGHTARNQALSERRANAVRAQLIDGGARPEQVSAVGFGHFRPNAPNSSPESKSVNRRAVVVVEIGR